MPRARRPSNRTKRSRKKEYEVACVLAAERTNAPPGHIGAWVYRIKWAGYATEDDWIERSMFAGTSCDEVLKRFWEEVIPTDSSLATIEAVTPAGHQLHVSPLWRAQQMARHRRIFGVPRRYIP